jgi:hypothetical protein
MKRIQSGVFAAIVCAAAVSVSAQTPPTPPAADTQPSYGSASNKITVTGCVERAKEPATPTGTTGAAAADTKFVLNNVMASAAPTTPETAGTSGRASIASSYRLDAEESKLSPHVGHKIEVTGTVGDKAMGATPAKLKVESVKMVAATCTP